MTMMGMPATERAVATVAQTMIRMLFAEAAQANQNEAKTMTRMRATETAPGTVLEPGFEVAAVFVKPRLEFLPPRLKSVALLLKLVAPRRKLVESLLEPGASGIRPVAPCFRLETVRLNAMHQRPGSDDRSTRPVGRRAPGGCGERECSDDGAIEQCTSCRS
jgi:hypothetical protein